MEFLVSYFTNNPDSKNPRTILDRHFLTPATCYFFEIRLKEHPLADTDNFQPFCYSNLSN